MTRAAAPLHALAVILVSSSAAASAMPTAVGHGAAVPEGLNFHKPVVLDTAALCDGSVRLEKGAYDVKFESLGGNRVRATFYQGGMRKGEANGIVIVNSMPSKSSPKGYIGETEKNLTFAALGLHPGAVHAFQRQGEKLNLVVTGQGTNQILIGLLLPAAAPAGVQPPGVKPGAAAGK